MENPNKKKSKFLNEIENFLSFIFFTAFILIIFLGLYLFGLDFFYKNKFFPRSYIAGIEVSGKSRPEAKDLIKEKFDQYEQGIIFRKSGMEKKYRPDAVGIDINIEKTINNAFSFGRDPLTLKSIGEKILFLAGRQNFEISYNFNSDLLKNFIDNEFIPNKIPINSALEYQDEEFIFTPGKDGLGLNKNYLQAQIYQSIKNLSFQTIDVPFDKISSTIMHDEIIKAKLESRKILNKKLNLVFEARNWTINEENIKNWLDFVPADQKQLTTYDFLSIDNFDLDKFILAGLGLNQVNQTNYNQVLSASLRKAEVGKFLEFISEEVNIKAQNAKFKISEGQIELLKPAEKGRELLIDINFEGILAAIFSGENKYELKTRETGADITEDNIADLGIIEVIAVGESDFSNSPLNRRHNIAVASEKLNGILIKPGEEYSLVENIGEVKAATGYLPELVIKENKTIPEYGGGLCQIATTNFRAAVNAGLEITERKSHSYAVSYYNPQGTDATMYIPRPDLRFINDTPGYILMQTKIENNKLYFEFYGTKDGREVELQGPYYWDRRVDGSFKAKWIQIVKMNEEIIRQQEFISFYDNPDKYH